MAASGVSLLMVGDELLDGRVADTNSAWLIDQLDAEGIGVRSIRVFPDDVEVLVAALEQAASEAAAVLVTGGLGPTTDDLTREALARLVGEELVLDPALLAAIEERFQRRQRAMPVANRRQAYRTPSGVSLPNPLGTAPGLRHDFRGTTLVLLPGVPAEIRSMWAAGVRDLIRSVVGGSGQVRRRLRTTGLAESAVADLVDQALGSDLPSLPLGYCVAAFGVDVLVRGEDAAVAEATAARLRPALGRALFAEGEEDLPSTLVGLLRQRRQTVSVAESCTGGLLGGALTSVAGSSEVFPGGVVTYGNSAKERELGVGAEILAAHGAVSEEVVRSMAEGVRRRWSTDWGVAITGVAGPGGGSPEKPVGTTWIAVAGEARTRASRLRLPGDRHLNRRWSVARALDLLRREVLFPEDE